MKGLILCLGLLFALPCFAQLQVENANGIVGTFHRAVCDAELTCTKDGSNRVDIELSGLQTRVLATATTITASQCGSTFYNGGAVEMELPEASTVLGCRLTFIVANASNFDIDPDDADQILTETNAAGDAIRASTLGTSITIEALSASQWAVVGLNGTWADND